MANDLRPYGARAVQMRNGSPWTGKTIPVIFVSGDSVAAFVGDFIKYTGTAFLDPITGIEMPVVAVADPADTRLAGAVQRFEPDRGTDGFINHRKASTVKVGYVPADRDVLYSMQEDAVGSNLAATDTEANADFADDTAGSAVTGISGMTLDSSSANTTSSLPLRLVRLEGGLQNAYGASTTDGGQWLVTINTDAYNNATGL